MHIWTRLKEESRRQDRPRHLPRRHGRARRAGRRAARPRSTSSASRTTPSSCTRPTTAPRSSPGPTAAPRPSAARRTPTGKAATACRPSSAGPGHQARHRVQRYLRARGHAADAAGRRRRARRQGAAAEGHEGRQQDLQGPSRRLRPSADRWPARRRARARSSSTSTTTASSSALRYDQWKIVFAEQKAHGARRLARAVHDAARAEDLQPASDPFEIGDQEAMDWNRWWAEHVFLLVPAQQYVAQFIGTFKEFPPGQRSARSRSIACSRSCSRPAAAQIS